MLNAFTFAFNAIAPMLLLMALGYWLKSVGYLDAKVLKVMNKVTFYFFMSPMAFCNVYGLTGLKEIPVNLMIIVLISLVVITLVGIFVANISTDDPKRKGVLVQASFRGNYNAIGISLAMALGGSVAAGVSASLMAPTVLYYNIMAVVFLTYYGQPGTKVDYKNLIISMFHNPLIVSLLAAMFCLLVRGLEPLNASGEPMFIISRDLPWAYKAVKDLAAIAPPLLLVLLGGTINFSQIGAMKKILTISVLLRLVVSPIIGFTMVIGAREMGLINVTTPMICTLVGLYASPAAVVSGLMAQQMGCDGDLGGQNVVWTTVMSMFTMLILITILRMVGLL